jgi:hypothetical protein
MKPTKIPWARVDVPVKIAQSEAKCFPVLRKALPATALRGPSRRQGSFKQ